MRSGRLFPNLFLDRALRQSRVRDLALAALAGVSLLWVAVPAWAQMACGSQSILDLVPAIEDADGDYVGDGSDNCVGVFNPHQIDADADGYGNVAVAPGTPASEVPSPASIFPTQRYIFQERWTDLRPPRLVYRASGAEL